MVIKQANAIRAVLVAYMIPKKPARKGILNSLWWFVAYLAMLSPNRMYCSVCTCIIIPQKSLAVSTEVEGASITEKWSSSENS